MTYNAFGKLIQSSGALQEHNHRNTGKPVDSTGLYYYGARFYDPELGRFISQDPIGDGLNWYAYCSNNPLNRIDPTGLREILEGDPNSGMFTVTADANSDSGYHIVEGGDRYRNSVEVDIANTMITGDERWINSSDEILSNTDAMNVAKTINTVANMTFGKDSSSYAKQQGVYLALFALGAGGVTNNSKAASIAEAIMARNGAPLPGYKGGEVFRNDGRNGGQVLPGGATYRSYDVNPYIKGVDRGGERIVIGSDNSVWHTIDHYNTFIQMLMGGK